MRSCGGVLRRSVARLDQAHRSQQDDSLRPVSSPRSRFLLVEASQGPPGLAGLHGLALSGPIDPAELLADLAKAGVPRNTVQRIRNSSSFQRAMMPVVRPTVGKLLAATLLILCIGVQVLEASGHWDRALKDSNDEAIIVVVVLCIGAAMGAAVAVLARVRPARIISQIVLAGTSPSLWPAPRLAISSSCASPPVSLRI